MADTALDVRRRAIRMAARFGRVPGLFTRRRTVAVNNLHEASMCSVKLGIRHADANLAKWPITLLFYGLAQGTWATWNAFVAPLHASGIKTFGYSLANVFVPIGMVVASVVGWSVFRAVYQQRDYAVSVARRSLSPTDVSPEIGELLGC